MIKPDYKKIIGIATALWLIALIVFVVLAIKQKEISIWLWVCLVGVLIGVYANYYVRTSWRVKND